MANKQAVLGSGARFTGKISNAKSIEINGYVEADLTTEKVTIGSTGKFIGAVDSDLVVIAGEWIGRAPA
jgi:cytoskeletal protein CcmA (bactofilin family)